MNNLKLNLIEHWYSKNRTDSDLAKALNVDQSLVSKWLSGTVAPTLERKIQIAKTIGIDSRFIFPETTKAETSHG